MSHILFAPEGRLAAGGVKQNDYLDWCKVAKLMNDGLHLTIDGLNLIRTIKDGMNKGRSKE